MPAIKWSLNGRNNDLIVTVAPPDERGRGGRHRVRVV